MWNPLGKIEGKPLLLLITVAASSGFILFGYDNAVFGGIIVLPWFLEQYHHPGSDILGTVSSLYNVGCAGGSILAFFFGGQLGRRKSILSGSAIAAVGVVIQCTSEKLSQLLVGRIVTGVGVGVLTSTVGLWQAETTPPRIRGMFMCLELMLGGCGLVIAFYTNYGFHNDTSRTAFVFPLALQIVFIAIIGVLVAMLPESPHWLFKNDRPEEALQVILRLEGHGATRDHPRVRQQLLEISEARQLEGTEGGFFTGIFVNGPTQNFKRICFGTGIMVMHQLNGINSVTYYVPTLVTTFIHASHSTALWVSGLFGVVCVVFCIPPVLWVDKVGRRPFLWIGSVGQCICFAIIAALFATAPKGGSSTYGIVTLAFLFLYYAINITSWFPITWLYPAELMPLKIREKGMGIAVFFYWMFQFMIVEVTPIALTNISYRFYIILCIFNAVIAAIVFFLYPETKLKSLEEIDFFFAKTEIPVDIDKTGIEGEMAPKRYAEIHLEDVRPGSEPAASAATS
ncbi:hypothetical protein AYL99_10882 [Fonsecaea erecta]|uniref:Major facilitator superfamily (MFS) profile domain-containing protein n=1 Tax=Fonsecaea erecta TaxID=1367422 RepID=A0A178Z650_9EURO|nr:hypothetical protein AYL99_10882 [Fonsecaea erecta]OAP55182.1 hypothetical protein AYL99_10882 [Fonsecaea erecta]